MALTAPLRATYRTRLAPLFLAAAAMSATLSVTGAIGTIVAGELIGTRWAALPNMTAVVGTGLGALALSRVMSAWGWRGGLTLGYGAAALGGALAVASVAAESALGLVVGMLVLGLGNAAAQLSRYVAADLAPSGRRGLAIGALVWAGTIGGVGGPLLLGPLVRASSALDWAPAVGPYLFGLGCLVFAVAATVMSPLQATTRSTSAAPTSAGRSALRRPDARSPLAVMMTGQVVMVLVMTATPLHMHLHGDSLAAVGTTISAHILGMFGLAPLTGRWADRSGPRPVMRAGLVLLAASAVLSAAADDLVRTAALFGLGYGWNLCFVGGSSALVLTSQHADRNRVEGDVDAAIWGAAALASLASTMLLADIGMTGLGLLGGALALSAAAVLSGERWFIRERSEPK